MKSVENYLSNFQSLKKVNIADDGNVISER